MARVTITLIGGPTALIEAGGFRFLTDPTFDPPGDYALPQVTLRKTLGPALSADAIEPIDVVLLSHDQHADNLDHAGRAFLPKAGRVFTTVAGAERLGGHAEGLAPWATAQVTNQAGQAVVITATPARHGPAGIEPLAGEVTGFVLSFGDGPTPPIYVTGDTVWFEGVAEVARRFRPGIVMPFAGAAQPVGPFDLTMDTNDTVEAAHRFGDAVIVPIHTDGWAHFTQGREDIRKAFAALGFGAVGTARSGCRHGYRSPQTAVSVVSRRTDDAYGGSGLLVVGAALAPAAPACHELDPHFGSMRVERMHITAICVSERNQRYMLAPSMSNIKFLGYLTEEQLSSMLEEIDEKF